MSFRRFLLKRLLYVIPTMVLVTMLVFAMMQLIPGDPVDALLGEDQDLEAREILIKELGLDQPLYVQYFHWMGKVVQGDLGQSIFQGQPVASLIAETLPRTVYLGVAAMFFALAIAIPLGIAAAVKRKSLVDYAAQVTAMLGLSVPVFWEALLLMFFFGLYLGWFPTVGYVSPSEDFWDFIYHLILPGFVLGFELVGVLTRMTRSTMLEELNKDYVQTHRSQGLPERHIIGFYTMKNAMLPTVTIIAIRAGHLLGGTVIIEYIFAWPGIGEMLLNAITTKDYPVTQGGVLILATAFIMLNLVADLLYKWLDPRITLE